MGHIAENPSKCCSNSTQKQEALYQCWNLDKNDCFGIQSAFYTRGDTLLVLLSPSNNMLCKLAGLRDSVVHQNCMCFCTWTMLMLQSENWEPNFLSVFNNQKIWLCHIFKILMHFILSVILKILEQTTAIQFTNDFY